MFQV
jgi:hypothetical protein